MKHIPALLLLLVLPLFCNAQDVKIIHLKNQKEPYHPKNFRIAQVKDARADTTNIGFMRAGMLNKRTTINPDNGAASALSSFINQNVVQAPDAQPIEMKIARLEISEQAGGMKEKAILNYAYDIEMDGQELLQLSGNSYVQTGMDASPYIEKLIRESIGQTLKQLDDYWPKIQAQLHPATVAITVKTGTENGHVDGILYSKNRPLTLNDFRGRPDDMSKGTAACYSGIALSFKSASANGVVKGTVYIAAIQSPEKSWCRTTARNAKTLAHEQLHFDITAVMACSLINTIRNYHFTPANLEAELTQLQKDNQEEWNKMENDYDNESVHGTVATKQDEWSKRVAALMAAQDCY